MVEPEPVESPPVAPSPPASSKLPIALSTLSLVIAAAALFSIVSAGQLVREIRGELAEVKAAQTAGERTRGRLTRSVDVLGNAVTLLSDEQIDLTNPKLQHLRHGFGVSEIRLERADTGVLVDGRMINASSLRYHDATFRLKVGSSAKEFAISNLPPGSSGTFEALLPNLPLESARTATLSLVSSAVEYAR